MSTLDSLRKQFPDLTKNLSDNEIIFSMSEQLGLPAQDVAKSFGLDPTQRSWGEAILDTGVKGVNALVGGIGAIGAAFDPSAGEDIDKLLSLGENALSLKSRVEKDNLSRALNSSDIGTQISGGWDYIKADPVGFASEAIGTIGVPAAGIKGAQGIAAATGLTKIGAKTARDQALDLGPQLPKTLDDITASVVKKNTENVGLAAGSALGAAMGGGDAAGEAYDRVFAATGDEQKAMDAARQAQLLPSIVGGVTGMVGLDKVLAKPGGKVSIPGTILVEGGTEFGEESVTKLEANRAVAKYVPGTDILAGVVGQGFIGMTQGGLAAGAVSGLNNWAARGENAALSNAINNRSTDPVDTADPADPEYIFESPEEKAARIKQEQDAKLAQQQAEKEEAAKLAAANQQANAQAQQQQQAQQTQQTTQQLYDQFGIRPVLDPQTNQPVGKFMLGDKIFFTEGDAVAFAKSLTEAGKDLSPAQQSLIGKLFAGGVVPVKATDTAKGLINKANRFMQDTQLASATDMNDVVSRIDQIIEAVAPKTDLIGGKMSKEAEMLTSLDKLRKSITGEASTRLGEIADQQTMSLQQREAQKAAKAAKGGKQNSATKAATPGNAQTSGGPNGQQQSAPGMGEVSEQGSAGGTVSSANGDAGSSQVQPVGSGSVADGSDGQQNDTGRGTGNEQRTVQPTADGAAATGSAQDGGQEVNPVYARYSSLTPEQQKRVSDITRISQADMQSPGVVAVNERQLTAAMDKVAPETKGVANAGQQTGQGNSEVAGTSTVGEGQSAGSGQDTVSGQDGRSDATDSGRDTERTQGGKDEEVDSEPKSVFEKVLEYIFVETGGNKGKSTAAKKVLYFSRYYGTPAKVRDESAKAFADKYELNVSTVIGWRKQLGENDDGSDRFHTLYKDRIKEALPVLAEREGVSVDDLLAQLVKTAEEARAERAKQDEAASQLVDDSNQAPVQDEDGAVELDTNDRKGLDTIVGRDKTVSNEAYANEVTDDGEDGDEQSGSVINSPGATSLSEQYNLGEGISKRYEKISLEIEQLESDLDNAQMEGDSEAIAQLEAKLAAANKKQEKLFADAEEAQRKSNRKNISASRGKREATEKSEASETKKSEAKTRKKAPGKAKAEEAPAPVKIEDTKEAAGQQWDAVANTMDGAPKWADLSEDQQNTFYEFGPDNWTESDVIQELAKIARSRNSKAKQPEGQGYKAADLRKEVVDFIGVDNAERLVIYQSAKDIPKYILKANPDAATAQGFVYGNQAYLIADNIKLGRGKAVFLHEVGSHLGLDEVLGSEFGELVDQIYAWAKADDGSLESELAKKAQARVRNAKSPVDQIESEMIAYFIEEAVLAGVEPSAKSAAGKFLKAIIEKFKQALQLLRMNPHFLSAQDVVDMAFGAARMEMSSSQGEKSSGRSTQPMRLSMPPEEIPPAQQRKIDRNLERVPKKARQFFRAYSKSASRLKNHARFTTHMLEQVSKRIPAAKRLMEYIRKQNAIRSEKLFEVEKITREFDKLKKPEQDAVNSIIKRSTSSSQWAFQPSWVAQDKTKIDTALRNEYNKLSDEAKAVIRNVFAYGYNSMMEIREAVSQTIGASYDERIAQANKAGNTKLADSLKTEKDTALGDYIKLFETSMNNPYAPLRRYGKHVVVYRSAEFLDADDVIRAARAGKDVSEEDLKAARKFIRENEGDPEHYQVYFREGALEAERLADELREEYGDGVQQFTRDEAAQQMYMSADLHGALYRLRKKANDASEEAGASEGTREALNKILSELHLTMLSEQSARHAEHKRAEGTVTGADDNMMRAFHSHGLATASMIASLNQSEKVQKAFEEFEREANSPRNPNRDKDSAIYNEVAARYAMGLDTGDTPITDTALRLNSAWMLLSRPLYYLQNGMQTWMMSAPYMAGKHGTKAYAEMLATYKQIASVLLSNRVTKEIIDKLPSDAKRVVYEMLDNGMLSISLDQDMGDRLRGRNPFDKFITTLQGVVERIEGVNRVITAVTAYRLERKSGVGHAKAIAYADEVVYTTHGDYSAFNAPRIMRNQVGRVLTQFRKFQLIQIGALTRLFREAMKGATPEEKFVARRGLVYTLGSVFMFGGLTAIPAFTMFAWVIGKVFGDEDEPQDQEAQLSRLRRWIGDPDLADLFIDGVPKAVFGFDGDPIFGGWGNMASLVPYTKVEGTDRRTYGEIVLGLAGPLIGGTGPKFFEGMGKIADGDITGGLQRILPTGAGNVIKAMELQDKGLTRKAGAEILSPDEVSEFQVFMKALGLSTGSVADKEFINRVTTTYDAFYRERSQQIKQQYSEAFEKGDTRKMAEAREMWAEMNESRRKNGFEAQPYSSLIRTPLNARKYERRVNNQLNTTGRELAGMR